MWDASDEALLAGFGTGEPTATAVFVRRFQSRVYGLAASILGDGPAAADVAQDAFVRAWRSAEAYDSRRGSVATWLLAITRNRAIDVRRMESARPADPIDLTRLEQVVTEASSPEEVAVAIDGADRARQAMDALPPPQLRALVLAAIGGRTAREISELEGIPLGTAKTRIRTALMRVRNTLRETEEHDRG